MAKVKIRMQAPKRPGYTKLRNPLDPQPIEVYTRGGSWSAPPSDMPTQINILGQHYKIYYHNRIYAAPKVSQRLLGVVVYSHRMIIIDPDQTIHEMRETLYHEVGHVYLKMKQLCSEPLSKITFAQMEAFCDLFGEAVCDLSRNNQLPR